MVTERIYKIGDIADRLGDRSTQSMLNWFYNEQTEEESIPALLQLDAELGTRPPAAPIPAESTDP
ncbi:MAG: ferritin-like domain-containing protein [Candidatus Thorarchaeota archaeon]